MSKAWLGLGANIDDRNAALTRAMQQISALPTTRIVKKSNIIESEPWGITDQPAFLNMAIEIETALPPVELLKALLLIETDMGRIRKEKWGPRVIDIDILMYDNLIINTPELTLPHPYITQRSFVIIPLAQLTPEYEINGKKISEWLKQV